MRRPVCDRKPRQLRKAPDTFIASHRTTNLQLVNELAFPWRVPTSIIAGVIDSVSRATVDVCYGGHVDNVSTDMGEHHELDEHENEREGSPVTGVVVVGPSSATIPPPEESGESI